jgi:hypothetical protein
MLRVVRPCRRPAPPRCSSSARQSTTWSAESIRFMASCILTFCSCLRLTTILPSGSSGQRNCKTLTALKPRRDGLWLLLLRFGRQLLGRVPFVGAWRRPVRVFAERGHFRSVCKAQRTFSGIEVIAIAATLCVRGLPDQPHCPLTHCSWSDYLLRSRVDRFPGRRACKRHRSTIRVSSRNGSPMRGGR